MKYAFVLALSLALVSKTFCQRSHLTISNDFNIVEKQYQGQAISNAVYHNNFFYTVTNSQFSAKKWLPGPSIEILNGIGRINDFKDLHGKVELGGKSLPVIPPGLCIRYYPQIILDVYFFKLQQGK